MQNKGWYPWQGQSSSSGSTENKEEPLVQPTTQNSSSNSTQPMTNASSQSGNQLKKFAVEEAEMSKTMENIPFTSDIWADL